MLVSVRSRVAGLLAVVALVCLAAQVAAADLKYLPGDTEILVTVNLRQILDSAVVKGQKDAFRKITDLATNALKENEEAERYLKATGIDLFRDIHRVTVAHPGGHDETAVFLIIEGNFDPDKFYGVAADAAKDHGDVLTISQSGKHKIIDVAPPNGKPAVIVMVDKNTVLVASTKVRITDALARAEGVKKTSLKKELKALLKATNAKQSISAVATGAALARLTAKAPVPNADQALEVLKALDGLSGAITIDKDVQFQLGIAARDENTAMQLAQQANVGLLLAKGLAAQQAKKNADLLPLVDVANTLRATAQGNSLFLRGQITVENIDKLIKSFPKRNQ
jgi:hypothetical protein